MNQPKAKCLVPDGEKGSPSNPLTVEELKSIISQANNGAEVEIKGFKELDPVDVAILSAGSQEKPMEGVKLPKDLVKELQKSVEKIFQT